jgi:transketolase
MSQRTEQLAINTIRTLAIDAIEKANSGHPGMPMGAAPMAYALWSRFLKASPKHPDWINRDRFVLSAGHGSMLLYSLLHLFNYDLGLEDLKAFRSWGSKTPGHPEFRHTPGVDATTGPLGQGIAMAVGMAMAERHLAATYNKDHFSIVDHYTYAICGDGDLMEGVASEAASLAGRLNLGRLVVLYDSNNISLDGDLNMSFNEDVLKRFEAYGWQTLRVEDGNDVEAISKALQEAKGDLERPTLIEVKTQIGFGAPTVAGTNEVHGKPLGLEEAQATKKAYAWEHEPFTVPAEVRDHFATFSEKGNQAYEAWTESFQAYKKAHPVLANQFETAVAGKLPEGYDQNLPQYEVGFKKATRETSNEVLNGLSQNIPQLFGGAADLASSTKTLMKGIENFFPESFAGRNVGFGVREFGMAAAVNGMALHGGVIPYGSTFFVFSDYLKPALRLAALMKIPAVFVFTHDSIAVGEDGPTHEPIEQLAMLRAIPNLDVIRPADGNETREAWKAAVESEDHPTVLVLSRQGLETFQGEVDGAAEGVKRGAYIVSKAKGEAVGIILSTGSEVGISVKAQELLEKEGIHVNVVSMPSWKRFEEQPEAYRNEILPPAIRKRVAVEAAASLGWHKYVGFEGDTVTIDHFGASANGDLVMAKFGFTAENIVEKMKNVLNR